MDDSTDDNEMKTPSGIEDYVEAERIRQLQLKKQQDKLTREDNCELMNILDRDFGINKSYDLGRDDHPTKLDFWSVRDPRRNPKFIGLMKRYRKTCWASKQDDMWLVEIDDY